MTDNIDVNAGRIVDGDATLQHVGKKIFDLLLRVDSGERTLVETTFPSPGSIQPDRRSATAGITTLRFST